MVQSPTATIKETIITYSYDKLERLTEEKIQSGDNQLVNSYTYDKVSNRLTKETTVIGDVSVLADAQLEEVKLTEGITEYAYNDLNQLVTEASSEGVINYTYDEKGSLIKQTGDQTIDYRYDLEGHLLRATVQKGNDVTWDWSKKSPRQDSRR